MDLYHQTPTGQTKEKIAGKKSFSPMKNNLEQMNTSRTLQPYQEKNGIYNIRTSTEHVKDRILQPYQENFGQDCSALSRKKSWSGRVVYTGLQLNM
eukprot:1973403-Amphidinium_carterae.1